MYNMNGNKRLDQSGATLLELLAVLMLITLVTGIIWTTISLSLKHNIVETSKVTLQKEANLIITSMQQEHRKRDCYKLTISASEVIMSSCSDGTVYLDFQNDEFIYGPNLEDFIEPKHENLVLDNFYLESKDGKLKLEIPTVISRYKKSN